MDMERIKPFGYLYSGANTYEVLQPEPLSAEWEGFGLRWLVCELWGGEVFEVVVPIQNCIVEYRNVEAVEVERNDKYVSQEKINQLLEEAANKDREDELYVQVY